MIVGHMIKRNVKNGDELAMIIESLGWQVTK